MGEDPRNLLDWHSSREDVKKEKKKYFKNNDRHNFLFLPQHLREVHRESGSAVRLTSTRQKTPLASENKRLHREREKKSPCLPSPYISLKAEIPLRALPLIHSHTRPRYVETAESRRIRRSRRCKWKDAGYSSSKSMNGSS